MFRAGFAGLILLFATTASAQVTGSCPAGTNNGTVQSGQPFRMYWCLPNTPNNNNLEGAQVSGLPAGTVQMDNVRKERGPFTDDNMNQWSGLVPAQPRGNYTVLVYGQNFKVPGDASTVQRGNASAPFALGVVDGLAAPDAPTRIRSGDAGNPARSATPDPATRTVPDSVPR